MRVLKYGKHRGSVRLKKDIVIPTGTVLEAGLERVEFNHHHVELIIGLTPNSSGHFVYGIDPGDPELDEWFEPVQPKEVKE